MISSNFFLEKWDFFLVYVLES